MFAIIQQDNKIHETCPPQQGQGRATVTGQTECSHHRVRYCGGICDSGQFDDPSAAAMGRGAASSDLARQGGFADTPRPDDRDQRSPVDELSQRGEILVTPQQLLAWRPVRPAHRGPRAGGGR
jgi:hypothetical protein